MIAMIAPRWRKAIRDLAETPVRTSLAALAMIAGVFGLAAIVTSYSILRRELTATYQGTHPASASLATQGLDDAMVATVQRLPGVLDAEARPVIRGRIRVGQDEWRPLVLFVIRDFDDQRINTFRRNAGAWPPGDDELLLERSSLSVARAGVGDSVMVRGADGAEHSVRIAGTVHAAGLAPGWMDHVVSGFVTRRSVVRSSPANETAQVLLVVDGNRLDEAHIRTVASGVRNSLEAQGRRVGRIDVPEPGRHPHAGQMDTFLFLLGAFGALTFALSTVLVASVIHTLLGEQVRQIGVMKAIGAATGQVAGIYLAQVSLLAAVALCIGMPIGFRAGRAYAYFANDMLNATISSTAVPWWVIAVEMAVGMLVPLAVAGGPIYQASRISIPEAFNNGIGRRPFGSRRFDRWLAGIGWLPRPWMLSVRTMFHLRGRLILTVGTLAVGGAAFISALNVSAAWKRALDGDSRARHYDLDVRLAGAYPVARLAETLAKVPDVEHAEYWAETAAGLVGADAHVPRPMLHGLDPQQANLFGPDLPSRLLALPLLQGRWLSAEDREVVVVNQTLLSLVPALRLGSNLVLRVNGRDVSWRVVGVVKEIAPVPAAYASPVSILAAMQQPGAASRSIRIVTRRHDSGSWNAVSRELERALERDGIGVRNVQALADARKAFEDHLVIINTALILAAALVVLVGALGLTSTLTLSVIERTREIGVLGAIGATPRAIRRQIVFQGVLIGALSWAVAVLAAIPISYGLDVVTGQIFIKSALDFVMSPGAAAIWLALVVIVAALSSFYPAWRAAQLTVREAIAYG